MVPGAGAVADRLEALAAVAGEALDVLGGAAAGEGLQERFLLVGRRAVVVGCRRDPERGFQVVVFPDDRFELLQAGARGDLLFSGFHQSDYPLVERIDAVGGGLCRRECRQAEPQDGGDEEAGCWHLGSWCR